MKLKKIASLALAGVMAVSMLAGCKNGEGTTNEGPTTEVVATSTTASVLRENLGGEARRNVKAVANSDLDAALKEAVADYCTTSGVNTIKGKYTLVELNSWKLGGAVIDAMEAEDSITDLEAIDGKDVIAVEVYGVDKSMSDNFVLETLADRIDNFCADDYLPAESDDGEYDYTYEISASIVTVNGNDSTVDEGAKFIAFAVTKNAEKYV